MLLLAIRYRDAFEAFRQTESMNMRIDASGGLESPARFFSFEDRKSAPTTSIAFLLSTSFNDSSFCHLCSCPTSNRFLRPRSPSLSMLLSEVLHHTLRPLDCQIVTLLQSGRESLNAFAAFVERLKTWLLGSQTMRRLHCCDSAECRIGGKRSVTLKSGWAQGLIRRLMAVVVVIDRCWTSSIVACRCFRTLDRSSACADWRL